jgi:hypothetical protein
MLLAEDAPMPSRTLAFGVPEFGHRASPGLLRDPLVFADEAAEDGLALDPLAGQVGDRVVRPGRVQLAAAMGSSPL